MESIQALGIVRFSYASYGGYQTKHASIDERLEYLFNPVRIEERFILFEYITLPAIRAQTDPDFTLIVVTSKDIPKPYLERLRALIDGIPQIALVLKEPQIHRQAMRQVIQPYKNRNCDVIAHFRLDDDDAVAIDFIERTKIAFKKCIPDYEQVDKCALDFNLGVLLQTKADICIAHQTQLPQATAGLVVFIPPHLSKTIIHYPHHRITDFMPLVTDTTPDMFVRSLNTFNDSPRSRAQNISNQPTPAHLIKTLQTRFKISIPDMLTAKL